MSIKTEARKDATYIMQGIFAYMRADRPQMAVHLARRLLRTLDRDAQLKATDAPPTTALVLWAFEEIWPRQVDSIGQDVYDGHVALIDGDKDRPGIGFGRWCEQLGRWPVDGPIPLPRDLDPFSHISRDGQMNLYG